MRWPAGRCIAHMHNSLGGSEANSNVTGISMDLQKNMYSVLRYTLYQCKICLGTELLNIPHIPIHETANKIIEQGRFSVDMNKVNRVSRCSGYDLNRVQ